MTGHIYCLPSSVKQYKIREFETAAFYTRAYLLSHFRPSGATCFWEMVIKAFVEIRNKVPVAARSGFLELAASDFRVPSICFQGHTQKTSKQ